LLGNTLVVFTADAGALFDAVVLGRHKRLGAGTSVSAGRRLDLSTGKATPFKAVRAPSPGTVTAVNIRVTTETA
jgi:hypothetical protein